MENLDVGSYSSQTWCVVIPTLNEATWIAHCVAAVRASAASASPPVDVHIIVSDGGSTDATVKRARRAGAHEVFVACARGRAAQLNEGIRRARADVVVLLHADALITPRLFDEARAAVERGAVGGWSQVAILSKHASLWSANALPWVARGINLRTRLFRTATADQAIFARRTVLAALGGVPDLPLMEGNALVRALRDQGPCAILDPVLRISGRRWETHGVVRTTLKMYALRAAYMAGVPAHILARMW